MHEEQSDVEGLLESRILARTLISIPQIILKPNLKLTKAKIMDQSQERGPAQGDQEKNQPAAMLESAALAEKHR
jgi:hypothetical protein